MTSINHDRTIRMLYGECSGIEELDCTYCVCTVCGSSYIEVFPKHALDISKMKKLTIDQAKNLGLYEGAYKEHLLCETCQQKRIKHEDILQILSFVFCVLSVIALTVLFSVGGIP
ncbi:MAG: hypothetical protein WC444_05015 [Candidatus Paceibacterota bacterium]